MECMSGVTSMWSYERGGPSAGPRQGGGEGQMCTLGLCSCQLQLSADSKRLLVNYQGCVLRLS